MAVGQSSQVRFSLDLGLGEQYDLQLLSLWAPCLNSSKGDESCTTGLLWKLNGMLKSTWCGAWWVFSSCQKLRLRANILEASMGVMAECLMKHHGGLFGQILPWLFFPAQIHGFLSLKELGLPRVSSSLTLCPSYLPSSSLIETTQCRIKDQQEGTSQNLRTASFPQWWWC